MIKVSNCVYEIVAASEIAQTALRDGTLNLTSYARIIAPQVEKMAKKEVEVNSIVVALSRLASRIDALPPLIPKVTIEELNINSPLTNITFEKTNQTIELTNSFLQKAGLSQKNFATVIVGDKEITFVISQRLKDTLLTHFKLKPKSQLDNLVGISLSFSSKYISEPNIIYAILNKLAVKRINIIEIVSTYTELSVIIEKSEMQKALNQLKDLFE